MPASSMSRPCRISQSRSGTPSWASTYRQPSTRRGSCCRRCSRNKWGRIINIASAHGLVASPFKSAYVAAKHGMVGLTKVTALETAEQGITCNAICPGYVYTPLVEAQIERASQGARHRARAGHPRRAARAAAEQAFRHGRGARRARRLPRERGGGIDHRRRIAGGWRLDRALKRFVRSIGTDWAAQSSGGQR